MFVYLTLILLIFQITSEIEENSNNYSVYSGHIEKNSPGRENNHENNHNLETPTQMDFYPHLIVRDEDPEFPLYTDSQVPLDNQDAEISAQSKGIKRYVEIVQNIDSNHHLTRNKNKLQTKYRKNKAIYDTAYYKMRRKRNTFSKVKLKTDTVKRSPCFSSENDNEAESYKYQQQEDKSAYRPNDECFKKSGNKESQNRYVSAQPTMLAEDYFQDETLLAKTTISKNTQTTVVTSKQMTLLEVTTTNSLNATTYNTTQTLQNNTTTNLTITKGTTEDMCKSIASNMHLKGHTTTQAPDGRIMDVFLKKLTNIPVIQIKSSTKSNVITLHHKEPRKEIEVTVQPIIQRVLGFVPKPTDKISFEYSNGSVTSKHKKVYPIRHKGGDPGNHYYHGKHPYTDCEPNESMKWKTTSALEKPNKTDRSGLLGANAKESLESNTVRGESSNINTIKSFITKKKITQPQGNKALPVEMYNGSTFLPIRDHTCSALNATNDIKEILPQRFHKEYLDMQPIEPMKPVHSVSKVKKKPKPKDKFYLCSSNKTDFLT